MPHIAGIVTQPRKRTIELTIKPPSGTKHCTVFRNNCSTPAAVAVQFWVGQWTAGFTNTSAYCSCRCTLEVSQSMLNRYGPMPWYTPGLPPSSAVGPVWWPPTPTSLRDAYMPLAQVTVLRSCLLLATTRMCNGSTLPRTARASSNSPMSTMGSAWMAGAKARAGSSSSTTARVALKPIRSTHWSTRGR
eukprot:jgi/Botrbrau1/21248/Bobra.39_2s0042.1